MSPRQIRGGKMSLSKKMRDRLLTSPKASEKEIFQNQEVDLEDNEFPIQENNACVSRTPSPSLPMSLSLSDTFVVEQDKKTRETEGSSSSHSSICCPPPKTPSSPSKRRIHSGPLGSATKRKKPESSNITEAISLLSVNRKGDISNPFYGIKAEGDVELATPACTEGMVAQDHRNSRTCLDLVDIEVESMPAKSYKLLEAEILFGEWETQMYTKERILIRTGKDGNDEIYKGPWSEPRHVASAKEILHRYDPQNEAIEAIYGPGQMDLETIECPEFSHLCNLTQPEWDDTESLRTVSKLISRYLLVDREETYRCLVKHPYYRNLECSQQKNIQQELIWFFDRRFTFQFGKVHGQNLMLDCQLLRLGNSAVFFEGLDTGGDQNDELHEWNMVVWIDLLAECARLGIPEEIEPEAATSNLLRDTLLDNACAGEEVGSAFNTCFETAHSYYKPSDSMV